MTKEDLKIIYQKANQYIFAKYGEDPYSIRIEDDGTLSAEYLAVRGCCGDSDEYGSYYFSINDLDANLEVLFE